jgi:NAD(P)-dependent dehydrogenase (short-subunit alcohol dehydrogenase family)
VTRRTALITGANRGIGRAVATELYTRDVRVVVTARVAEAARRAATGIADVATFPDDGPTGQFLTERRGRA